MNVAHLRVLIDGSAAGALKALAAARVATRATARTMNTALMPALKATAAGFAVLGSQAIVGGVVALGNALAPLVGLVGLLPGALLGAAAAAGTLKLALVGVSDAISSWDDPEKFKAALDSLTPSAREFVLALKDIHDNGFTQLRLDVQESLFADLGETVEKLATVYLPMLSDSLTAIAASFRRIITEAAEFGLSADTIKDVASILDNIRRAFADFGGVTTPLLSVFTDLATVSATFLPGLAVGATHAAEGLRDMVAAGRESGGIADFIQGGLDAARELGGVLGNVGGIIHAISSAGPGAGLLTGLKTMTQGLEDFLKSSAGQKGLQDFFGAAADAGKALMPVLTAALKAISQFAPVLADLATHAAPGITTFINALGKGLGTLGPAAGKLGDALSQAFTQLAPSLGPLADIVTTVAGLVGDLLLDLVPLVPPILNLAAALGQVLVATEPLVAALAAALVPLIDQLAQALIDSLPAWMEIIDAVIDALPAFQALLAAVIPLIPVLIEYLVPAVQALSEILVAVTPLLQDVAAWMGENQFLMMEAARAASELFGGLNLVLNVAGFVREAIVGLGTALGDFSYALYELPGQIVGVFSDVGSWLWDSGKALIQGFIDGILSMTDPLTGAVDSLLGKARDYFPFSPAKTGPFSGEGYTTYSGAALMDGFAEGALSQAASTQRAFESAMSGLTSAFPTTAPEMPATAGMGASLSTAGTVINVNVTIPAGATASDAAALTAAAKAAAHEGVREALAGGVLTLRQMRS